VRPPPPLSDPMPHMSEKGEGEGREEGKEREGKEEGNRGKKEWEGMGHGMD